MIGYWIYLLPLLLLRLLLLPHLRIRLLLVEINYRYMRRYVNRAQYIYISAPCCWVLYTKQIHAHTGRRHQNYVLSEPDFSQLNIGDTNTPDPRKQFILIPFKWSLFIVVCFWTVFFYTQNVHLRLYKLLCLLVWPALFGRESSLCIFYNPSTYTYLYR